MAKVHNGEEILRRVSTFSPLSREYERYRRLTDERICDNKDLNVP